MDSLTNKLTDPDVWWAEYSEHYVTRSFIDHITPAQNELLFRELSRVLKPGALLLVKSPSKYNRFDQDGGHVTFFSPGEFREFVQSFLFEVLDQPYIPQPILGTSRLASLAVRLATKVYRPEKWSSRIDLIARKSCISEACVVSSSLTN